MSDNHNQNNHIQFKNISYQIGQACLLDELSGEFLGAKIHAIVGQNGAGKSTLLRCLSKEWPISSGKIDFNGQDLRRLSYAKLALQRSVLPQQLTVAFSFTVEQLVGLGFEAQQIVWSNIQKQTLLTTLLNAVGITHLKQRDVLSLSGGEQKRVQLARVLAQIWPVDFESDQAFMGKWLFLDEWSEALDLKHQVHIGCLFRQLADKGLGIVMVSHDLNQVLQLADSCTLLKAGRMFAQGPTAEVMSAENLSDVLGISVQIVHQAEANQSVVMLKPINHH